MSDLRDWFEKQGSLVDYEGFKIALAKASIVGPFNHDDPTPIEETPKKATLVAITAYLDAVGLSATSEKSPYVQSLQAEILRLKAQLEVAQDRRLSEGSLGLK